MSERGGSGLHQRDLLQLQIADVGEVVETADPLAPVAVLDGAGEVNEPVARFVRHLVACDYSSNTCRSYAQALLRWLRFLAAVSVAWDQAERSDVRDFVLWMRTADNPQRRRHRLDGPAPGSVNAVTGKRYLSAGYAPATINHCLAAINMFYDYHVLFADGPIVNPVPSRRGHDGRRALAHHSPIEKVERLPRAAYRQRQPSRPPRALAEAVVSDFMTALSSNRDRAIVSMALASGPRAAELLALRLENLDIGRSLVALTGKGHRDLEWVPTSPEAMLWLAAYLAETEESRPAGDTHLWWTLRRPPRHLTYTALRAVVRRANTALGANITFHDLRHTYAMRLMGDPNLLITEVQRLMRHRSLASTQIYARAQIDDLVAKMREHYTRPEPEPARLAADYDPAAMSVLFPDLAL